MIHFIWQYTKCIYTSFNYLICVFLLSDFYEGKIMKMMINEAVELQKKLVLVATYFSFIMQNTKDSSFRAGS